MNTDKFIRWGLPHCLNAYSVCKYWSISTPLLVWSRFHDIKYTYRLFMDISVSMCYIEWPIDQFPPSPTDACHNKECPFLHIDPESKQKDCPWYDRGFCRHGPLCRNRHVRRVLCLNYLAGFCPSGGSCQLVQWVTAEGRDLWTGLDLSFAGSQGDYSCMWRCPRPGLNPSGLVNNSSLTAGPQFTEVKIL